MRNRQPRQHRQSHQNRRPPAAPRRLHNDRASAAPAPPQRTPACPPAGSAPAAPTAALGPQPSTSALPSEAAPPDEASSWPRIAPIARMMAMCPIMFPTPAVNDSGTCFSGIPAATPSAKAAIDKPQRRVQLALHHQQQKQQHRSGHAGQQVPVMSSNACRIHRQIIPHRCNNAHYVEVIQRGTVLSTASDVP